MGFSDGLQSKTTADDADELAKRSGDNVTERPSSSSKLRRIHGGHVTPWVLSSAVMFARKFIDVRRRFASRYLQILFCN